MNNLNPTALSLWISSASITYGISGDVQNSVLALGIATAVTTAVAMFVK